MSLLLAKHVAWRFAITVMGILAVLTGLITIIGLVETSKALMQHPTPWYVACTLAGCIAVDYAYLLFPVAILLALMVVGTQMARSGELGGLQAQGLGTWAMATPFVLVTLVMTGAVIWASDRVLPKAAALRRHMMAQQLRRADPATTYFQERSTWYQEGPWIVYLPELDARTGIFHHPYAYKLQDGRVVQSLRAARLTYDDASGWVLHDGSIRYAQGRAPKQFIHNPLPLSVTLPALTEHMGNPKELRGKAAQALIARRRMSGLDTALHHIELLGRLIYPLCAPLYLWAGLPWALAPDRRRALAGMLCVASAAVAWVLVGTQVIRLLALAHRLPLFVGAFAPMGLTGVLAGASVLAWWRPWAKNKKPGANRTSKKLRAPAA